MPQETHYYIFFAETNFEAFEFRLEELLAFCRRRGWPRPFVSKVLVTTEGKRIVVEGPGVGGVQVQIQPKDSQEGG